MEDVLIPPWLVILCCAIALTTCNARLIHAQNTGALLPNVQPTFFNASGSAVNSLGFVCTTVSGGTTALLTYQDSALTTANQDPIRLNAAGRAVNGSTEVSIFLQAQSYRISVYAAGTGNTCNGVSVGTLLRQVDNVYDIAQLFGIGAPLAVTMRHSASGNVWTVYDTNGSVFATPGTTTQGLQEAINRARATNYPLIIYGGGLDPTPAAHARIDCTTPIAIPNGEGISITFVGETDLLYDANANPALDFITFDTMDVTSIDMANVQIIYTGNAAAVHFKPGATLNSGGVVAITSSRFMIGNVAVVVPATLLPDPTHGIGVQITSGTSAVIGNDFYVREIQGGLTGFKVDSPTGSPSTGFELNDIRIPQIHNVGTTALLIGTTSTNATKLAGNQWYGTINGVNVGSVAIDTWGQFDGFTVSIRATSGVVLESSATGNQFRINNNGTSTPFTDNSTAKDNIRLDSQQQIFSGKSFSLGPTILSFTPNGANSSSFVNNGGNGSLLINTASTDFTSCIFCSRGTMAVITTSVSAQVLAFNASGGDGKTQIVTTKTGSATTQPLEIFSDSTLVSTHTVVSGTPQLLVGANSTDFSPGNIPFIVVSADPVLASASSSTNATIMDMTAVGGDSNSQIVVTHSGGGTTKPLEIFSDSTKLLTLQPNQGLTVGLATGTGTVLNGNGTVFLAGLTAEGSSQAAVCQNTTTKEVQVNTGVQTCTVSSLEFKEPLGDISCSEALRIVKGMRPGIFKDKTGGDGPRFGFAAEWTAEIEPRLVDYDEGKPRAVDYERYTAVLTKALQCQLEAK